MINWICRLLQLSKKYKSEIIEDCAAVASSEIEQEARESARAKEDFGLWAGYLSDIIPVSGFSTGNWGIVMAKESSSTASSANKADANLIGNAEGNGLS
ncbi:MAG: hypothetical protein E5W64_07980, partial [Mesorhizobium sp.]